MLTNSNTFDRKNTLGVKKKTYPHCLGRVHSEGPTWGYFVAQPGQPKQTNQPSTEFDLIAAADLNPLKPENQTGLNPLKPGSLAGSNPLKPENLAGSNIDALKEEGVAAEEQANLVAVDKYSESENK